MNLHINSGIRVEKKKQVSAKMISGNCHNKTLIKTSKL